MTTRRVALLVAVAAVAAFAAPGAHAAVWCGNGETAADRPDIVTGAQVHLVYAIPSDGIDGFAAYANEIVADTESIDAWWRREDPLRTPRFDLASFPGCVGLDLGVVRLTLPTATLLPSANRFGLIQGAMPRFDRWKKTVVYYDGPISDPNVCGTATGSPAIGSDSLAVIYPRSSCVRSQSLRAAVVAHELTHELGSPDRTQVHRCAGDSGHVCDTNRDLMYPFLSVQALEELILDAGRDDYYRQGGVGFDLSTSEWLRKLDGPQQLLSVGVGSGVGTIRSDMPGIACASCSTLWDFGAKVRLAPEPAPGQRFLGWGGACSGVDCVVTMTAPASVQALFGPSTVRLSVALSGKGRVLGPGIACPLRCGASVDVDVPVRLTARPAVGWRLVGWTGACKGASQRCTVTPQAALAVRAAFAKR